VVHRFPAHGSSPAGRRGAEWRGRCPESRRRRPWWTVRRFPRRRPWRKSGASWRRDQVGAPVGGARTRQIAVSETAGWLMAQGSPDGP